MIIDLFLKIPLYIIGGLLDILPVGEPVNPGLITYMGEIGTKIRIFDAVIPIDTIYQMIIVIIVVESIIGTIKMWDYVRTYIPFIH